MELQTRRDSNNSRRKRWVRYRNDIVE